MQQAKPASLSQPQKADLYREMESRLLLVRALELLTQCRTVAEIACVAGSVLNHLNDHDFLPDCDSCDQDCGLRGSF